MGQSPSAFASLSEVGVGWVVVEIQNFSDEEKIHHCQTLKEERRSRSRFNDFTVENHPMCRTSRGLEL